MKLVDTAPSSQCEVAFSRRRVRDGAIVTGSILVAALCIWLGAQQSEHRMLLAWAGFWSLVSALWAIHLVRVSRSPDSWVLKVLQKGVCARLQCHSTDDFPAFLWIPRSEIESVGLVKERRIFYQREEKITTYHPCLEIRLERDPVGVKELEKALRCERDRRANTSLYFHPPVMVDSPRRIRIDLKQLRGGAEAVFRSLTGYRRLPTRELLDDMTTPQAHPEQHILETLQREGRVRARILGRKIYRMKDTDILNLLSDAR